jgi:hypothetical protein
MGFMYVNLYIHIQYTIIAAAITVVAAVAQALLLEFEAVVLRPGIRGYVTLPNGDARCEEEGEECE